MLKSSILCFISFVFAAVSGFAQNVVNGTVMDADTRTGLLGAVVRLEKTTLFDETAEDGSFSLKGAKRGSYVLTVTLDGFAPAEQPVSVGKDAKAVQVFLKKLDDQQSSGSDDIPTVTLDEAADATSAGGDVSSALGASRDVFLSQTGFNLNAFRFSPRGYDGENTLLYLNYVPMNDVETGFSGFSEFSGLNDVTRSREQSVGLEPTEFSFAGIGGAQLIDTRASRQRKGTRVGYASTNRTYRNRVMATHSTGVLPFGWAVSASASYRWAEEGYQSGTNYSGVSYFLAVDKKLGERHNLSFNFLGAQIRRGVASNSWQEMYEASGDNNYNPNWGFWNGAKRNAVERHQNQPIAMLRHDYENAQKMRWTTVASVQAGPRGQTAFDWYNAPDPRPDYYRNMGFYQDSPDQQAAIKAYFGESEANRQVNWSRLYDANTISNATIENADGSGQPISGRLSRYLIEDRRQDSKEANLNTVLNYVVSSRFTVQGGGSYQYYVGQNFKTAVDLLGGEFSVNYNRFAARDVPGSVDALQNDLNNPNGIVREGGRFGYDYDENIRNAQGWAQGQLTLKRFDFFAAGQVSNTQLFRVGNFKTGLFPDNSFGKSAVQTFTNFGTKAGVTFKITPRHYLYANGGSMTRAPQFQSAFLAPRVRDAVTPNLTNEKILTGEAGYLIRTPRLKGRVTAFFTEINDQTNVRNVIFEGSGVFGSLATTDIDERHVGVETGIDFKVTKRMSLLLAGTMGENFYTSRPKLFFVRDNLGDLLVDGETVYQKNFYVPRTPQRAGTATIKYDLPKFTFVNFTFNYASDIWMDFDRVRRTADGIDGVTYGTDAWNKLILQEKVPANWTLDFFGGKSWKIGKQFLNLNIGASNLLNKKDILIGGYENGRFTVDETQLGKYPKKLIYGFGTTYFAGLTWRL